MRKLFLAAISVVAIAVACTDTSGDIDVTGPQPQVVAAVGPSGGVVACDDPIFVDAGPIEAGVGGGNCAITVKLTFTLPAGQFVREALIRFQGDGSNIGIDRDYPLTPVFGMDSTSVTVTIDAAIPTDILRRGALYTYEVRLITGAGAVSAPSTLTVSVT